MILLSSFLLYITAGQLKGHARPLEGSKNIGDRNIKVNEGEQKMQKVDIGIIFAKDSREQYSVSSFVS